MSLGFVLSSKIIHVYFVSLQCHVYTENRRSTNAPVAIPHASLQSCYFCKQHWHATKYIFKRALRPFSITCSYYWSSAHVSLWDGNISVYSLSQRWAVDMPPYDSFQAEGNYLIETEPTASPISDISRQGFWTVHGPPRRVNRRQCHLWALARANFYRASAEYGLSSPLLLARAIG